MFDRFRPYFSVFVSGLPAMFVVPLTIRLYRYPFALVSYRIVRFYLCLIALLRNYLPLRINPFGNVGCNVPTALGYISADNYCAHTIPRTPVGSSKPTHDCPDEISGPDFLLCSSGPNLTFRNLSSNVACHWQWEPELYLFSMPCIWDVCNDHNNGFCERNCEER